MDKVGDKSSSSGTPEEDDMPDKLGIDVLTAHPSNPTTGYENNAPVLTLFDSALVSVAEKPNFWARESLVIDY